MTTTASRRPATIEARILDASVPWELRKRLLINVLVDENPASQQLACALLEKAAQAGGESVYARKIEELAELKSAMESAPLRMATFVRMLPSAGADVDSTNGNGKAGPADGSLRFDTVPRAHVLLEDGASAFTVVPDAKLAATLRLGDSVLLEAQGRTLMYAEPSGPESGELAQLERRIDAQRVEVLLRDHERCVCLASARVTGELEAGTLEPGEWLLVCPRRRVAFAAVPRSDRQAHYRHLVREPVPEVVIERDIGDPPPFLADLTEHVWMVMTDRERGRRYGLQPCQFVMLCGVSGSGKTLCIQGFWRRMYEVMSAATGIPLDQLPPRVLRLRTSAVLSKWYGESEKLIDRFFDEVEQIAAEEMIGADGRRFTAPALVICEEADGVGRARGSDAVHDRVQNTVLERLDTTRAGLRQLPVIFLFSTNLPQLVDAAFMRRACGITVSFGRLSRRGFANVLDKHLRDRLVEANGDGTQAASRRRVLNEVMPWLFSPRGEDQGVVEITYAGATQPETRFRRDFLTGAVVSRAVQEAAAAACRAERHGAGAGVTSAQVIAALDRQIRAICDQLHTGNVGQYLTLPDGARVANVRRLPQPTLPAAQTMR